MAYESLKVLWATLSGTPEERLAQVNALTVEGPPQSVPVLTIMTYLRTNNLWLSIKAAQSVCAGAAAAVDYNEDLRVTNLDVGLPIVQAMLKDLVDHKLLSSVQVEDIIAMGTTAIPWWQENGYTSPFNMNDLQAAGLV